MTILQTRRRFLTITSMAGAAGLVGVPRVRAAEGALETTTVRLVNDGSICIAPEYVAEELLLAEGFTDIRYVNAPGSQQIDALLRGELDFSNFFPGGNIDANHPDAVLEAARRVLTTGRVQVWFPEAWRSPDGRLQRFLPGIGQLLLKSAPRRCRLIWAPCSRRCRGGTASPGFTKSR
jgi:hypothetical protein